jgi:hypothetical protein
MNKNDFVNAYSEFWLILESEESGYCPFPFETCDLVETGKWWHMSSWMVSDNLRSVINLINAWRMNLSHWAAWMRVLEGKDEQTFMELQFHFLDHLIFFCMFQPSSFRDALAKVATHAIHQGNLSVRHADQDRLVEDELSKGQFLDRKKTEKQLRKLGQNWKRSHLLIEYLAKVDSNDYRQITRDYRNSASHAIPPRFGWGEINFVTRSLVNHEELVDQGDGTYQLVADPNRKVVSYAFGGTPPLNLEEIYQANLREHELASQALESYCFLLEEIVHTQLED